MRLAAIAAVVAACCNPLAAEDLRSRLDAVLGAAPAGAGVGVVVVDTTSGATLYSRDPERLLSIASVTKVFVAMAALWELGPDHAFRTRVAPLGQVRDGVAPGLVVIGGGSPCLDEHFSDKQPDRFFQQWAAALKAAGVTRVDGDLVIDARMFAGPCKPATYPQDAANQQRWYSAPASAFAWNDNCIEVRVVPTKPGQPCSVQVRPRSSRIAVRNLTKTVAKQASSPIKVTRDAAGNGLTLGGTYAKTTDWFPLAIHDQPDLLAGEHLKAVLADAGIAVSGEVVLGAAPAQVQPIVDLAQPLLPALAILNQRSQNFYGEQILRVLGHRRAGEGSVAAGGRALAEILAERLPGAAAGAQLVDGSGLSYANRASAGFVAGALAAIDRSPLGRTFAETLKLEDSVKPAARVKTGTLAIACCLAGFVERRDGSRWAFAILLNKEDAKSFGWAGAMRDKALRAIAAP